MSNITKNHKVGIFAIFIASALMLGTVSISGLDSAFATDSKDKEYNSKDKEYNSKDKEYNSKDKEYNSKDKEYNSKDKEYNSKDKDKHESKDRESKNYNHNNNGNEAEQEIEQQQFSSQDSQCISGEDTTNSCDNLAVQLNLNTGNQALGQQ